MALFKYRHAFMRVEKTMKRFLSIIISVVILIGILISSPNKLEAKNLEEEEINCDEQWLVNDSSMLTEAQTERSDVGWESTTQSGDIDGYAFGASVNNSMGSAIQISDFNQIVTGRLENYLDKNYFRIEIPKDGYISFDFSHDSYSDGKWRFSLLDKSNKEVLYTDVTATTKEDEFNQHTAISGIPCGTYYFRMYVFYDLCPTSSYSLRINYHEASDWEKEFNESRGDANKIEKNSIINGNFRTNADVDFFRFFMDKAGDVTISFMHKDKTDEGWMIYLMDSNGNQVGNFHEQTFYGTTTPDVFYSTTNINLDEGTYYIRVKAPFANSWEGTQYSLRINSSSSPIPSPEPAPAPEEKRGTVMSCGYDRTIPDGYYQIVSAVSGAHDVALDIPGNTTNIPENENVQIWHNVGMDYVADVFYVQYDPSDKFYTISQMNGNKALDVPDGDIHMRTNVSMHTKNGSKAQKWAIDYAENGWYRIQAACNSFLLDVVDGKSDNGTNVWLFDGNGSDAQKWAFVPWGPQTGRTINDGDYHIISALDGISGVGIDDSFQINGEAYHNAAFHTSWMNEKQSVFSVTYNEAEGNYSIVQKTSGRYLDIQKGGAVPNLGVWEKTNVTGTPGRIQKWVIKPDSDGYYNIVSQYNGTYADVLDAKAEAGQNIWLFKKMWMPDSEKGVPCQKWKFVRAVDSVSLNTKSLTLTEGDSGSLSAQVLPSAAGNKTVSWTSSNSAVAEVNSSGRVTAKQQGTAVITAKTRDGGYTDSCTVTVAKKQSEDEKDTEEPGTEKDTEDSGTEKDTESDTENPTAADTIIAVKQKLDVTSLFTGKYKKYQVSPTGSASITSKGILTAKKAGEIRVVGLVKENGKWVADSENEVTITSEQPEFEQKSLILNYAGATLDAGENLKAMSCEPDSWTTSNKKVAEIDSKTGTVTAVKAGSARITAVFGEGKNAAKYSFTVKVVIPSISKKKASMQTGAEMTLKLNKASEMPEWTSSDDSIAEVDENGKVTANSAGEATITASLDGVDYSCAITVKKPTLSVKKMSLQVGKTKKISLRNTRLKEIDWVSSDESVAEVDEDGVVTAIGAGEAEITTTTGGCSDSCKVTVK